MLTGPITRWPFSANLWTSKFSLLASLVQYVGTGASPNSFVLLSPSRFTPGDAQSPVGLQWYLASDRAEGQVDLQRPDTNRPVEGRLLCSVRDNYSNPCLYDGVCVEGACQCIQESGGSLCEQPPLGNGWCDGSLNTPQYDLDAGDCCDSTCVSKKGGFTCGREAGGFGYIGYDCKLPTGKWEQHKAAVELSGGEGALVGYSVAISRQGNFIAVGIPGQDMVLLFDRDGGTWKKRGFSLIGVRDTRFGEAVRVSSGPDDLYSNPEFKPPFVVAVGSGLEGNGTVYLFRCETDPAIGDCSNNPDRFDGYSAFDLSDDGGTLVLGESHNFTAIVAEGEVSLSIPKVHLVSIDTGTPFVRRIIDVEFANLVWNDTDGTPLDSPLVLRSIKSVSASRDAGKIAIQTTWLHLEQLVLCLRETDCADVQMAVKNSVVGEDDKTTSLMEVLVDVPVDVPDASRPLLVSANGQVVVFASFNCNDTLASFSVTDEGDLLPRPPLPSWPEEECDADFEPGNISLALSANGNTVAVGYKASAYVYDFNGTTWNYVGDETLTQLTTLGGSASVTPVALSGDGTQLALGIPTSGTGGKASIFSTPHRQAPCNSDEQPLLLSYTTDKEPSTLSWTVYNNDTLIEEARPGRYQYEIATYVHRICVPRASCSIVTFYDQLLRDASDDRWYEPELKSPGRIDMELDHTKVAIKGFNGAMRRVFLGNDCLTCPSGTKLFRMMMRTCEAVAWELVDNVGNILFHDSVNYYDANSTFTEFDGWNTTTPLNEAISSNASTDDNIAGNAATAPVWNDTSGSNVTAPPIEPPAGSRPCETDVHWEEVCLDLSACYTFYAFKFGSPEGKADDASTGYENSFYWFGQGDLTTEFHLFLDDRELSKSKLTEEGQKAIPVGKCTRPV